MKICLYVDEDAMDEDLIYALRIRGVDIMTALEADMIERNDQEHLDYATAQVVHYIVLMLVITIGFIQSICLKVNPMQGSSTTTALFRWRTDALSSKADCY